MFGKHMKHNYFLIFRIFGIFRVEYLTGGKISSGNLVCHSLDMIYKVSNLFAPKTSLIFASWLYYLLMDLEIHILRKLQTSEAVFLLQLCSFLQFFGFLNSNFRLPQKKNMFRGVFNFYVKDEENKYIAKQMCFKWLV